MMKKSVGIILAVLLVVSLAGNAYQFTLLQAAQEHIAASAATIDEISAKYAEQTEIMGSQAVQILQLKDELAAQTTLIEQLNQTKVEQELEKLADGWVFDEATNTIVKPTPKKESSVPQVNPDVKPPAQNKEQTDKELWDDFAAAAGKPGEGGGGTTVIPGEADLLRPN